MPRARAASTPSMLETPLSTVTISDGRALRRERDDARRQPVAELKAIRHQEVDVRESERAHRAHEQRAAGGAVRIEVPDHEHPARFALRRRAAPPPARLPRACRPAGAARATDRDPPRAQMPRARIHTPAAPGCRSPTGIEPARLHRRRISVAKASVLARRRLNAEGLPPGTAAAPEPPQPARAQAERVGGGGNLDPLQPPGLQILERRTRASAARPPATPSSRARRQHHDTRPAERRPREPAAAGLESVGYCERRWNAENSASSPAVQPATVGAARHRPHRLPKATER